MKLFNSKRAGAWIAVVGAFGMIASGCNSSSSASSPAAPGVAVPPAQQNQTPAWKLVYQSNPGSVDPTTVVGAYGFTVAADGTFLAGPGPNGETQAGTLGQDEFANIQTALQPVLQGTALSQPQACAPSQVVDFGDSLTFVKGGVSTEFLTKATDGTVCANGYDVNDAEGLRTAVIAAANNHYALPFPSACLEAANAVQALYSGLSACSQDSDCTYVDQNYNAIPSTNSETVYIDSCSVVQSLPVANANALQAQSAALQAALLNAQTTCGADNIIRNGCTSPTSFNSMSAAPACVSGVCKVNPSLQF